MDIKGKIVEKLNFPQGTIQYTWNYTNSSKETSLPIDVIQIKGGDISKEIFEAIANYSDVEWSHLVTRTGTSINGFLTTSHEEGAERGIKELVYKKIIFQNYRIIQFDHNHPKNTPLPSGYGDDDNSFNTDGNWGDRGFVKKLQKNQNTNARKRDEFYQPIRNRIYLPNSKSYIEYDENGLLE